MLVKDIIEEDFTNYYMPSMFLGTCFCNWKCPIELGLPVTICQNSPLAQQKNTNIDNKVIYNRYLNNLITKAIVIGGLEPFLQFEDVFSLVSYFRENNCNDDIVIYTGYYPSELQNEIELLKHYKNIIIKFGRYVPDQESHFDEILGVELASNNQYGVKIS